MQSRAEQELELALGRLQPATTGKRKDEVEMGCGGQRECTMRAGRCDGGGREVGDGDGQGRLDTAARECARACGCVCDGYGYG